MRAAILVVAGVCAAASASAQPPTVFVYITYTPQAAAAAGGGAALTASIGQAVTQINQSWAAQGLNYSIGAEVASAKSVPPDVAGQSTLQQQYNWVRNDPESWLNRTAGTSAAGIVIAAPTNAAQTMVQGVIPGLPPTSAADASAAINVADLQNQLEIAIAAVLGNNPSYNVYVHQHFYPYQGNGGFCFRTRGTPYNPAVASGPYPPGYVTAGTQGSTSATLAGDQQTSCGLYVSLLAANTGNSSLYARGSGGGGTCTVYDVNGHPVSAASAVIQYITPTGSSNIYCAGDTEIPQFSCYGTSCVAYQGYAIGSATQNAVNVMNARYSVIAGLPQQNQGLWNRAKGTTGRICLFGHCLF